MSLQPGSGPGPGCPDYKLIRKLGAGAFGEVWHAHGPGGLDVALKFIRLEAPLLALELRSLEVMKSIRHPNLVSLFGAWHKDRRRRGRGQTAIFACVPYARQQFHAKGQ